MGIEPTQSAWKAEILAIELHPQIVTACNRRLLQLYQHYFYLSTLFLKKLKYFFLRLQVFSSAVLGKFNIHYYWHCQTCAHGHP